MKKRKQIGLYLAIILATIMFTLLMIMAANNSLVADDYYFFSTTRDHGIFYLVSNYYVKNGGRVLMYILLGLGSKIFGNQAVMMVPALAVIFNGFATSFLFYQLFPKALSKKIMISITCGFLASNTFMYFIYNLYDSWLWTDAGVTYMGSVFTIIYLAAIVVYCTKNSNVKLWKFVLFSLPMGFWQLFTKFLE